VAHGIEQSADRTAAGKSSTGNIILRAYHRGNHIYIEVEDDGSGINYERVKAKAPSNVDLFPRRPHIDSRKRDLREMLFHPGFSTAPVKTELAGRGVGLDVVRANLNALQRRNRHPEHQRQGHEIYAQGAPDPDHFSGSVCALRHDEFRVAIGGGRGNPPLARADEIEDVGGKLLTKVRDVVTEVVRLDTYLGLPPLEPINGYFRMVVAKCWKTGRLDSSLKKLSARMKSLSRNLGEYLRRVKLFPGTTIAPDGSLILLIDLNRMVATEPNENRQIQASASAARIFAPGSAAIASGSIPSEAIDRVEQERVIVVADDSISVAQIRRPHAGEERLPA